MFIHEKLICYQKANVLVSEITKEFVSWNRGYSYLSDQLKRSLSSIILNLTEGVYRKSTKERQRFFEISKASASESAASIDLCLSFNLISKQKAFIFKGLLLEIVKMLSKLQ